MFVLQALSSVYEAPPSALLRGQEWIDVCNYETGEILSTTDRTILDEIAGNLVSGFGWRIVDVPGLIVGSGDRKFRVLEADRPDNTESCRSQLNSYRDSRGSMSAAAAGSRPVEVDLDTFHAARIGGDE